MDSNNKITETKLCPNCRKPISPKDEFCSGCGAKIGEPESQVLRVDYQALALLLGPLAVHNFYAGFLRRAFCQLGMTLVGGILWQIGNNALGVFLIFISGFWAIIEIFFQRVDAKGLTMRKCGCLAQLGMFFLVLIGLQLYGHLLLLFLGPSEIR